MKDTDILSLAIHRMSEYDQLSAWNVRLSNRLTSAAGMCSFNTETITLSIPILTLWDEAEVLDTVLHEIAHALAGPYAGHGPEWKSMCRRIGAKPNRCYPASMPAPVPKWTGRCVNNHVTMRNRRDKVSCAHCSPVFDSRYMFKWEETKVA